MRYLLPVVALLILPARSNAQGVRIGIRAGVNAAFTSQNNIDQLGSLLQTSSDALKLEPITAYHVGISTQIGGPRLSIQPELVYSKYGARATSGINQAELKSNVIELPLLAKYTFESRRTRFFINAGPYINFALSGIYTVDARINAFPIAIRQDIEFETTKERIAYGFTGGAGFTRQIGRGRLLAEVRYNYALRSKVPSSVIVVGGTNLRLQIGMISVGYSIPISR